MRFVTRVRAVVFAVAVSLAIALPGQALAKDGNHGNHCGKGHAKHSRAVGKSCSKHHHSSAASRRHHGAVTAAVTTRGDEQSGSDDDATEPPEPADADDNDQGDDNDDQGDDNQDEVDD